MTCGIRRQLEHRLLTAGNRAPRLAKFLYDLIIAEELMSEQMADALASHHPDSSQYLDELTILVKTFERPRVEHRLIASIRRLYPQVRVLVVDDSRNPVIFDGVETVVLPYDTGLSAGRNEGLRRIKSPYVLVLDDDFVFYRHTDLNEPLEAMERYPEIDIMGGVPLKLPFLSQTDYWRGDVFPAAPPPTRPRGTMIGRFPVCDKVENFFVGRTERLRLVEWDPRLKFKEHKDFFSRARGTLTTVLNPRFRILHARTPLDTEYLQKRNDYDRYLKIVADRWGHF